MINAREYEELLNKAMECLDDGCALDAIDYLESLLETQDIYKKSNIEGVFIKVGKLTTRNEIILDTPPNDKVDNSEPIVSYERGWWYFSKNLTMNSGNGQYRYLETKPYNIIKDTGEKIEELCSIENEYNVLGYVTRLKNDNRMRDMVLYNQYLTGEEHGVVIKNCRDKVIGVELPDGTKTKIGE